MDFLNEKLCQYMAMYNDTVRGAHLDLVFFKDAMTHLVKVGKKANLRQSRVASLMMTAHDLIDASVRTETLKLSLPLRCALCEDSVFYLAQRIFFSFFRK